MMEKVEQGTLLVYAFYRTEAWWTHLARNMGFGRSVVISDERGAGDIDVVDDFYRAYELRCSAYAEEQPPSELSDSEIDDVIARCRVLRWLPRAKAKAMAEAMADVMGAILDKEKPRFVMGFPIDRYVSDVLCRLAARRGILFMEMTVSAIPGMVMFMHRGRLLQHIVAPEMAEVESAVAELSAPLFVPSYVQGQSPYTGLRFLKVFTYFRMRGNFFWLLSHLKRDPLNLHHLDSQSFLGHKPSLRDIRIIRMLRKEWREAMSDFSKERRIFLGLQLFPEASIDYWIGPRELIDYEDIVAEAAEAFSTAGFLVLIKDHPLQFGFRQTGFIDRLLRIRNVVLVPYEVSGNELLDNCGANFALTGTLGLQAALRGMASVTTQTYYTSPEDFILLGRRSEIPGLPEKVAKASCCDLAARRRRIISHLLRGSFQGDFFSFRGFDPANPTESATELARVAGAMARTLLEELDSLVPHREENVL